jgi:hypothetical protein
MSGADGAATGDRARDDAQRFDRARHSELAPELRDRRRRGTRSGAHGDPITRFRWGKLRQLEAEQDPEGVPEGSPIAECKPSFSTIESG